MTHITKNEGTYEQPYQGLHLLLSKAISNTDILSIDQPLLTPDPPEFNMAMEVRDDECQHNGKGNTQTELQVSPARGYKILLSV